MKTDSNIQPSNQISTNPRKGYLFVNLGTPANHDVSSVRRYLREFLFDPAVIDLPVIMRFILVYLIIAPFRGPKSARNYQKIWTEEGSPLMALSKKWMAALRNQLTQSMAAPPMELAMRYGQPSIANGIHRLRQSDVTEIHVVPLYPQFADATTGSTERKVLDVIAKEEKRSSGKIKLTFAKDFFDHPLFVEAWSRMIPANAKDHGAHVVFSFHGLPESQVRKNKSCEINSSCCHQSPTPRCYRAQSLRTAHAIAEKAGLRPHQYSIAFQSRLGRQKWLEPSTDHTIAEKAKTGTKKLFVLCPSFVTDCLETIEEIGMGQKENFLEHGGQEFHLIPSLNAEPFWIDSCQKMFVPESLQMERNLKQNKSESPDNLSRV